MSRERLRRAEKDLYSRHSQRIPEALELHELDYDTYAVLSFLVDKIEAPGSNGKAVFTLKGLADTLRWPHSDQHLRDKLRELRRQDWIDYEDPRRGPGAAWIFRLSGAAIDAERDEFPVNFKPETPSPFETNSNYRRGGEAVNPLADGVSDALEFPTAQVPRAEQSRAEALSEERNYDYVVGKTTAAPPWLDEIFVRTLVSEDDLREQAFLRDCQALVDVGAARWRDDDDAEGAP